MIWITRLGGRPFVLNSDLIESIESTPDTVITLRGGAKLMVRERIEEIVAKVVEFRRKLTVAKEAKEVQDAPSPPAHAGVSPNAAGAARAVP